MKRKTLMYLGTAFILIGLITLRYLHVYSVGYQMSRLERGSAREKNIAASFLADRKVYEAIPLLIRNVNNEDRDFWEKDPKGGRIRVSCVVTYELENLTGQKKGNLCNYDGTENDADLNKIKQDWIDWFNGLPK